MRLEKPAEAGLRIRLDQESADKLWKRVEDKGVRKSAEKAGVNPSKVYNWRSSGEFIPAAFAAEFVEDPGVMAIKGDGRSKPIENPQLSSISRELLTRVSESVNVNSEGVPVYQNAEIGPTERFVELLECTGDVPYRRYSRRVHEVRYPKYLQDLFQTLEYEPSFAARVDESGEIEEGEARSGGKSVAVTEFAGSLYSRRKMLKLALAREDRDSIERMLSRGSEVGILINEK